MNGKTYILLGFMLTAIICGITILNFSAEKVSAQKSDEIENLGTLPTEYNARNEFALTQGGTSEVWNYGFSNSATDNAFTQHILTRTASLCGGNNIFEEWYRTGEPFDLPSIRRNVGTAACFNVPPETLILHPSESGRRAVLRWIAPASGTFQVNGVFNRVDNTTTDVKILKNAATVGEATLFSGNIIGSQSQQPFNFTVTAAMGDTIDFSVGYGTDGVAGDSTGLAVTIGQPVTACLTTPANLQVNVPAENSPIDVQSVNTNASLVGDAGYTNSGKVGRAFEFDGNGDYVRIEDNAAQKPVNQLTLEGWFKFNNTAGFQFLATKPLRSSNTRSYALWSSNGSIQIEYNSTSGSVLFNTGFVPPVNVWNHYAMVINTDNAGATANTIKLYANGVEIYSNTANNPIFYDGINNANTPLPFLVGGGFDASNIPNYHFNGQADEVSVYGRALAQSEIFDIVQQGSFGKCPPAACVQSPNNLVSWFAGEQNALDSKSNNHGTLFNGVTFPSGKVGQSFSFDGTNDYVQSPTFNLGANYSLEFWMYPTTSSDGVNIISNDFSNNANYGGLYFYTDAANSGHLEYFFNSISRAATPADSVPRNAWSHIGVTYDGSITRLYINGSLAATSNGHPETFNNSVVFGSGNNSGASYFQGNLDEISFYNRVLSASEMSSINNAGHGGKCKPSPLNPTTSQVAWFTADGDARDFTGLNPNGILRGDANYKVGKVGQGFNFDGNGDYVEVADDADHKPTNQLTLEGWFKPNNLNGVQFLASKPFSGNGTIRSYALWNGPTLHIEYRSTGGSVLYNTGITPQINIWTHYAMVINTDNTGATANTIKLYLNGVEVYTNTANDPIAYGGAIPFFIGAGADSLNNPTFFFNGQADEVSLYSRALSANEIAAIYNAGTAGKLKSAATPVNFGRSAKTAASLAPTTVQLSSATVTFAQVTSAGTTSQSGSDLGLLPQLPSNATTNNLNYDLSTTAAYSGNVTVCFNVPAIPVGNFAETNILHLENGVWKNAVSNTITRNYPQICGDFSSLSPFAVVQGLAPSAAGVALSGRVVAGKGQGVANVLIHLTDQNGNIRTTRTNHFGFYRFLDVEAGQTYVVNAFAKRYQFQTQVVFVNNEMTLDLIAIE